MTRSIVEIWEEVKDWPISCLLGEMKRTEALADAGASCLYDLAAMLEEDKLTLVDGIGDRTAAEIRSQIKTLKSLPRDVFRTAGLPPAECRLIPQIAEAVAEAVSLEEEILALLCLESPRNQKIMLHRWGFFAEKPPTLERLGEQFKISRERVRQIEEKIEKRLSQVSLRLPKAEEVVETIDRRGGAISNTQLLNRLKKLEFQCERNALRVLPKLSRLGLLWHVELTKDGHLWVTPKGERTWIATGRLRAVEEQLLEELRKDLRDLNAVKIPKNTELPFESVWPLITRDLPEVWDFVRVGDFMVPVPAPANKLTRRIDKILSVCVEPIPIRRILTTLSDSRGIDRLPPFAVFETIVSSRGCYRVIGKKVTANHKIPPSDVLSESEQIAVNFALEKGGIIQSEALRDHIVGFGYSTATASAILGEILFERLDRGWYALVGISDSD